MKAKILIVEDDPALQELMQQILSWEGFEIETCPDGNEAFQKIVRPVSGDHCMFAITCEVIAPTRGRDSICP